MKRIVLYFAVVLSVMLSLTACKKTETLPADPSVTLLKENLSATDFAAVDQSTVTSFTSPTTGQHLVRAGFSGKNPGEDFVLLQVDADGKFEHGKIVHLQGKIQASSENNNKKVFNGSIETSSLQRTEITKSVIEEGFIMALHTLSTIQVNSVRGDVRVNKADCDDCTLPEVIVSASYSNGSYDWGSWMSLWWLLNTWPQGDYIPVSSGGGGGGGASAPSGPPVVHVDIIEPEDKARIEPKKYTDCFDGVSSNLANYSITIAADLPIDNDPSTFFNWTDRSPGHAYIELYKGNPSGSVRQSIGFYPNSSFKVLTGDYIPSKIVDDGGHEYQATYTISVSAAQFQAAVDRLNAASSNKYRVDLYNCADFALDVFNAGGGGLTIPKHYIPGFPISGGSNTPQGLYEKIQQLKAGGVTGAHTTPNKEYTGGSKGPCN